MADNEEFGEQQAFVQPPPPAAAPPAHTGSVHLPAFWPHAPQMWFVQTECVFHNKRITDSFNKHCLLIAALPHDSLCLVMDLAAISCDGFLAPRLGIDMMISTFL